MIFRVSAMSRDRRCCCLSSASRDRLRASRAVVGSIKFRVRSGVSGSRVAVHFPEYRPERLPGIVISAKGRDLRL